MLLNSQLLKLDKFGASGLQIEATSRFVGYTFLAGAHNKGHKGGRLDLRNDRIILGTSKKLRST